MTIEVLVVWLITSRAEGHSSTYIEGHERVQSDVRCAIFL
jgi:hypothetical protein